MFNRELVKGSTSLLLLHLLDEQDMYGYQLAREMERRSEEALHVKEGTLYPALKKLEEKGYIDSYWVEQEKGPARKYYRISEDGKVVLLQKSKEWNRFVGVISKMLGEES
ncbi:helix-turn-helix transcriptional regulator [Heyndrickxia oleronia]|uniref:PadR family transcriptional regulator n=1 Tax=Heyndrickxia oleronia TaxID=38875 RepID=UPI00203C8789|nr:helix-turn-helix transcriptional regulator [Heyndrickxia oleronia]MCM3240018.1 helix-turn-helix transcriptional regulator [Heyndrickxia oleronia]MCM3454706.1 helix-turn-helix transcriptional regulator [Heyndrickxia oleronia]